MHTLNCQTVHFLITTNIKAEFSIPSKFTQLSKDEINVNSWFTIVLFERVYNSRQTNMGLHHINIYTFDYTHPWVKILCKEVILKRK
jgi:hypothetical protein